jgi:hypothetical protein
MSSAVGGHALLWLRNAGTLKIIPKAMTHTISIGPSIKIEGCRKGRIGSGPQQNHDDNAR